MRRVCKDIKEDFKLEIVLACHSSSDPADVAIEILGKFSNDFFSLRRVEYLVELPPGTYWKKSSSIAYVVSISNASQDDLNLFWKSHVNKQKEALLPRAIVASEISEVNLVTDQPQGSPFCVCYTQRGKKKRHANVTKKWWNTKLGVLKDRGVVQISNQKVIDVPKKVC